MDATLKKFHKTFFVLVWAGFLCQISEAQNIDSALVSFSQKAPYEKIYVHFDNTRYIAGETIWYKAYLIAGSQPSLISKNAYIDWYSDEGQLIKSTVTPIINSCSPGNFTIPKTYGGKFIHAIAYTRWMRNFDSSYFYKQTFAVVSNRSSFKRAYMAPVESSAQFLPESGAVLLNKRNVIAFKAVNSLGLPERIQGIVKNSRGDSIVSFRTVHDGMGKFQLKPLRGEKYIAVWTDASGKVHQSGLPDAEESAVNLLLEPGQSNRIFHIQRTQQAADRLKQLTLVGQMNGIILYKANIDLTNRESFTSNLACNKIPSGILQLTVFDAHSQPLCERLVFIRNDDCLLNATLEVDTLNTKRKGKNILELGINDTSYANFSVSVTDADINAVPDNSIIAQLLLSGDLTGAVYKPAYYFSSNADSIINHLDLVMLTNGWRRYNWEEILYQPGTGMKYAPDSAYQTTYGKIMDYKFKKNKKPEFITLIFVGKDAGKQIISLPIAESGRFFTSSVMLFDTAKVYYSINGSARSSPELVDVNNDLLKPAGTIPLPISPIVFDTLGRNKLLLLAERQQTDTGKYQVLENVSVDAKQMSRLQELDAKYATGVFSGLAAASFDMSTTENASHRASLFDFLSGKVPELQITADAGGTATEGVVQFRRGAVNFYLDEIPVSTSELVNINVDNIAYIKVFNPPFTGGFNQSGGEIASGGAIVVYTKKGIPLNSRANDLVYGGIKYKLLSGYAPRKEFYEARYSEKSASDGGEDLRLTLLWKPWIELDKATQKAKIVFYNNDVTHSFRVVVEGMDRRGKLIHMSRLLH